MVSPQVKVLSLKVKVLSLKVKVLSPEVINHSPYPLARIVCHREYRIEMIKYEHVLFLHSESDSFQNT